MLREYTQTVESVGKASPKDVFDTILKSTAEQLMSLPFEARAALIESFSTLLLRGFVPMSGMTVQQPISADQKSLDQLNVSMQKKDAYRNGTDPRYVYQFAREATSAGILPAYRDKVTGDIYIALICNKRNLDMYNWSAGYTEAPLPSWQGKLLSEQKQEIYYDRAKIKNSATSTMLKILEEACDDWTKVDYSHTRFEKEFKSDGVTLPKTDINSFHTAVRECIEEINLDLGQFPQRKTFLISYDNTVGISQGDAPGQTSNRSHQYLVFLGSLDVSPEIKHGDDVAIADWVNVSKILRKNSAEYFANGKPLCVYMLRSIELGLKDLWDHLLQQASTRVSHYSQKAVARFSSPENMIIEIENFCDKHKINIERTNVAYFLRCLSGDLPFKTRTGKMAQELLNCTLEVANYLLSPQLNPRNFLRDMTEILSELNRWLLPTEEKEKSSRLFSPDYYLEIASIFEKLPEKHAEKQAEEKQHKLSLQLVSGTPYVDFYNVFMELNKEYGPGGDYATKYLGDSEFVRCRYPTIFTRRQEEFSGGCPLGVSLQDEEHKPGKILAGVYPAAKIAISENKKDKFVVLGEGPYEHTFSVLLDRLEEQKVNVLIAVGPPEENGKEKYFNYMSISQEISAKEYLRYTTAIPEIPGEFTDSQCAELLTLKFYKYVHPGRKNAFYIMHIPSWKDLGMPVLTDADKHILAYDAEYGSNRFYHCSAGVGRSVSIVMMRMVYELILKNNLDFSQAVREFELILKRIKDVKPRAGEWWQLLLAIGLAEDMYKYMSSQLTMKVADSKETSRSSSLSPSVSLPNTIKKPQVSIDSGMKNPIRFKCAMWGCPPPVFFEDTQQETLSAKSKVLK